MVGVDANGCTNDKTIQITVNSCNGIVGFNSNNPVIQIYPNPSNGEFFVSSDSDIHLYIINQLGQEVSSLQLTTQNDFKVAVTNLANGIYLIVGQNANGLVNQKLIIAQ